MRACLIVTAVTSVTLLWNAFVHAAPPAERVAQVEALVTQGKFGEAIAEVDALLKVDPDDARLKELRRVLARMAAPAAATRPVGSAALSAEDSLELATIESVVADLAKAAADPRQAAAMKLLAQDVITRTTALAVRAPDEPSLWLYRAAAALSLDDLDAGYESGKKLKASGAMASTDSRVKAVMVQLNRKGWLDEEKVHGLRTAKAQVAESTAAWLALVGDYRVGDQVGEPNSDRLADPNPWTGKLNVVLKDGILMIEGSGRYKLVRKFAHLEVEHIKYFEVPLQPIVIPSDPVENKVELTGKFKDLNREERVKAKLVNRMIYESYRRKDGLAAMQLCPIEPGESYSSPFVDLIKIR